MTWIMMGYVLNRILVIDQDIELLVGFWDLGDLDPGHESLCPNGSLRIFKYGKVWKSCADLHMVTCVTAGRLCSNARVIKSRLFLAVYVKTSKFMLLLFSALNRCSLC